MAIFGALGDIDVGAISKSISATASDIFVYDTRKDSDGGAWRKRTQHTSWYNETLNTATRGSRRDFPAVAVIVATDTNVTIYDGDDPDMPMWMVFNRVANPPYAFLAYTPTAICMLNGILMFVGYTATRINFIQDFTSIYFNTGYYQWLYPEIINRNASSNASGSTPLISSSISIISVTTNDVAMTVIPNAPIDPSTGLPVPTIAVATAGGVSVIKDDGSIANITPAGSRVVSFDKNNGLWINFTSGASDIGWYYYTNFTSTSSYSSIYHNNSGWSGIWDMLGGVYYRGISYGYSSLTTGTLGLSNFDGFGVLKASTTMSNFITTTYNTGWMHGDIKGAWLSDTSTASVTGTELVTNGDMSSSTGWSVGSGISISGGVAVFSSPAHGNNLQQTSTQFVAGRTYVITFNVTAFTSGAVTLYANYTTGTTQLIATSVGRGVGIYSYTWTASTSGTGFTVQADASSNGACILTVDNVSIRIAELDRSVNNRGLAVYGTITKTAVATGADLVGYSGFSDGDYLKQPHNSSLEFGTGSFSCTVWFKSSTADVSNYKGLVYLNRNGSLGEGFQILLDPSNGIYFYIYGPTNDFNSTPYTGYNDGNWHQISVSSTGTHQRVYLDGVLKETGNITTGSITDTSSELFIGKWYANTSSPFYWRGSIALCRISASIPSPEQILKIYNDEKALFQENSQCTLYGSSDSVTALAYDDSYSTLLVGTSSGRSDFRGLERINNTTTAVTTAISASNGLIAEQ